MKTLVATIAFGIAAIAPSLAGATTQDAQFPLQAESGTRFEIVDQATGRPVAVLVPVEGTPGTLRIVGIAHAASTVLPLENRIATEALTPGQMLDQLQRENDARFHTMHDGG